MKLYSVLFVLLISSQCQAMGGRIKDFFMGPDNPTLVESNDLANHGIQITYNVEQLESMLNSSQNREHLSRMITRKLEELSREKSKRGAIQRTHNPHAIIKNMSFPSASEHHGDFVNPEIEAGDSVVDMIRHHADMEALHEAEQRRQAEHNFKHAAARVKEEARQEDLARIKANHLKKLRNMTAETQPEDNNTSDASVAAYDYLFAPSPACATVENIEFPQPFEHHGDFVNPEFEAGDSVVQMIRRHAEQQAHEQAMEALRKAELAEQRLIAETAHQAYLEKEWYTKITSDVEEFNKLPVSIAHQNAMPIRAPEITPSRFAALKNYITNNKGRTVLYAAAAVGCVATTYWLAKKIYAWLQVRQHAKRTARRPTKK